MEQIPVANHNRCPCKTANAVCGFTQDEQPFLNFTHFYVLPESSSINTESEVSRLYRIRIFCICGLRLLPIFKD